MGFWVKNMKNLLQLKIARLGTAFDLKDMSLSPAHWFSVPTSLSSAYPTPLQLPCISRSSFIPCLCAWRVLHAHWRRLDLIGGPPKYLYFLFRHVANPGNAKWVLKVTHGYKTYSAKWQPSLLEQILCLIYF